MIQFPDKQPGFFANCLFIILIFLAACSHEKPLEKRIYFPAGSWPRYNILKFELPVTGNERSIDVIFELRCKRSFIYDELPLNMVLNTPSGEERIKEYKLQIRDKNGSYTGILSGDTCITSIFLKRKLYCSRKGGLKVEIENLNPRLETEGVISAGLILIQH